MGKGRRQTDAKGREPGDTAFSNHAGFGSNPFRLPNGDETFSKFIADDPQKVILDWLELESKKPVDLEIGGKHLRFGR